MAARIRFIKSPLDNTIKLLAKRMDRDEREEVLRKRWGAVGLVHSQLVDLFVMADTAEKNANVVVREIKGICPQHFSMIATFGDTSSVEAALNSIREIENRRQT